MRHHQQIAPSVALCALAWLGLQAPVSARTMNYQAGSEPVSVAAGDFNGDGIQDLAVANASTPGELVILLGQSNGSFTLGSILHPTTTPESWVIVADFNNDDILDLAVTAGGTESGTFILLGNGDGTFQPPLFVKTGPNPRFVATADFNGDGELDLAVAARSQIEILLGQGNGHFQKSQVIPAGTPTAIVVADFNGDGVSDIVYSDSAAQTVSLALGNGNGTFQSPTPFAVKGAESVAVGDFNDDGALDLAVPDGVSEVGVLLGSNGGFGPPIYSPAGSGPVWVLAADLNGDGNVDLAVTDKTGNTLDTLLGNGNGTFQAPIPAAVGRQPVDVITVQLTTGPALITADSGSEAVTVLP